MSSVPVPLPVDELAVLRRRRSAKWRTHPADVRPLTTPGAGFVRLNFGTSEAVLAMAIERMAAAVT
jgi:bifunctional pyridoxal-dependent enzyme with beta-cystathionase and maltose regulon repressor activities